MGDFYFIYGIVDISQTDVQIAAYVTMREHVRPDVC
jgi:hypothetical protein